MALSVRSSQRAPFDSRRPRRAAAGQQSPGVGQTAAEGTPVAGAPGWHVIRRTAPVPSSDPMRRSRYFRLSAIAVTAGLVPLLFVLSMVRAQLSEAPAGQTVVVPVPPPVISPGPRSAPRPTPAPAATTEEPTRPQDTVVTAMLQTKPDPLLPDELALLPVEPIEVLQRSTAELEIRPEPVGLSAAPLPSTTDGSPSRVDEPLRGQAQSSRSSPQVVDAPANLRTTAKIQLASEASTLDDHSAVAPASSPTRFSPAMSGSPSRVNEPRREPQSSRSSQGLVDAQANLRSAAEIQLTSQATTADDGSALPAGATRVFIHHVADQRDGALAQQLAEYLRGQGFTVADIRSVDFGIARPSVRYFFARDRAASQRLVEELGRFAAGGASLAPDRASDFTHFLPKPRPGSLEVWLPGT
jgi:hypothetical protein